MFRGKQTEKLPDFVEKIINRGNIVGIIALKSEINILPTKTSIPINRQ